MSMSIVISHPFAPAFVADVADVLGARFDDLLRIAPDSVAGLTREAFIARMLDGECRRTSSAACPEHGRPIGPAQETIIDTIGTDHGRSVMVVRRLDAAGDVTWWTANTFDYASGARRLRARCPSRKVATEVAVAEWAQIRLAMRRAR